MDRYRILLKHKPPPPKKLPVAINFRTRLFNRDLYIALKKIKPKEGNILFLTSEQLEKQEIDTLQSILKSSVAAADNTIKDCSSIITNYTIKIRKITPQKNDVFLISAPGTTKKELKTLLNVIKGLKNPLMKVVCVNHRIKIQRKKNVDRKKIKKISSKNR